MGEPHRGTGILVLGVVSLFVMPLPLGLLAWFWGSEDLKKMDSGRMDPEGRGTTQAGKVCGMISSLLSFGACCVVSLYFLGVFILAGTLVSGVSGGLSQQQVAPHAEKPAEEEARKRKQREDAEAAERARRQEAKQRADAEEQRKAAEAAKKRRAAEAKKAAADEEAAAERLRYAKKLIADGMDELAKERLQKIVKDFPGSKAAEEARGLLKKLERD
jgi:hypothetical protein